MSMESDGAIDSCIMNEFADGGALSTYELSEFTGISEEYVRRICAKLETGGELKLLGHVNKNEQFVPIYTTPDVFVAAAFAKAVIV